MSSHTYYVDSRFGEDSNTGLSPSKPFRTYQGRSFSPGDTILFKRGSVIRDILPTSNGTRENPIIYGAYGTGAEPVFLGSVSVGEPENWVQEHLGVWRYQGCFSTEVCNIIFNHGESCGNLRWRIEDLKEQGEWFYTRIGNRLAEKRGEKKHEEDNGILHLFSEKNPGIAYSGIECALWGQRRLAGGNNIILENLSFQNSGVHGFAETQARNVVIRNCTFRNIGGAVWSRNRHIRLGNAIEFWNGAADVVVEHCKFDNIYDSGVTHQGCDPSFTPERIYFRNNRFSKCGMAAYECRGPGGRDIYFENNTCLHAGEGFALQGEVPPRQSEIYPEPMGHHVFIWRMDDHANVGPIYIRSNNFYEAKYGMAIYSMIDPEDEKKFIIDKNRYRQTEGEMLVHMTDRSYRPDEFSEYQKQTGYDTHGILEAGE